jgi:hypothetical protein
MTLPVGNLGTRFGEGKMAFETTRLRPRGVVSLLLNRPGCCRLFANWIATRPIRLIADVRGLEVLPRDGYRGAAKRNPHDLRCAVANPPTC